MTRLTSVDLARDLAGLFAAGTLTDLTDGQLLDRFIAHRDDFAFKELIARHGRMVLSICRRSLDDPRDVEDAFQATFLILLRKAASLRDRDAVSSWLHGVASRVVRRARQVAHRRRLRERPIADEPAARPETPGDEVAAVVDQEIGRLPRNQQLAVIFCLIEGYTHEAAAAELGWPLGTVKSRIAAARQTLTRRLTRRGLTPSAMAAIARLGDPSRSIPESLARETTAAARWLADPPRAAAAISAPIAGLMEGASRTMVLTRLGAAALVAVTLTSAAWTASALLAPLAGPSSPPSVRGSNDAAPPPQPRRTDRFGDPLPPGAVLRLGTVRYRHDRFINNLEFTPDGKNLVTDDQGRSFQVWDAATGRKLRQVDSGLERTRYFDLSPDGTTLAAIEWDEDPKRKVIHRLTLTDLATGRRVRQVEWPVKGYVYPRRVHFSPDGRMLATTAETNGYELRLWNVATMKVLYQEGDREGNHGRVAFSPDPESHLLAIARKNAIRLLDTRQARDVRSITLVEERHVDDLAFSPDGRAIVANVNLWHENIHEFWLWRTADGAFLRRFASPKDRYAYAMTFSPDGKILAAIGDRDQVLTFDVATGKATNLLPDARASARPIVFSPDGRTLAAIHSDQVLHFWDLATGKDRLATPDAHQDAVSFIGFLDGGKTLLSDSRDGTIRSWDLATGRPTRVIPREGPLNQGAISADGSLYVATSNQAEREICLCRLATGERYCVWSGPWREGRPEILAVTFGPGDSSILASFNDGSLRSWEIATGKLAIESSKAIRQKNQDPFDQAFVSPDRRSVALGTHKGEIEMIEIPSGKLLFRASATVPPPPLPNQVRQPVSLAFAPDGRSLAIVRRTFELFKKPDGEWSNPFQPVAQAIVWLDAQSGRVRREIPIADAGVGGLTFSPDGQYLAAVTGQDGRGTIRVFRLRDKREVRAIEPPSRGISSLAFTPDGRRIAAGLFDTSVVLWDVRGPD